MTSLERSTNGIQKLLHQGVLAERDGNRAEARRCFEAVRAADPDNVIALLWLAWLAPTKSQSMTYFCRVLELDPQNEKARAGIRWARQRPETTTGHMVISRTEEPRPAQKPVPAAAPPPSAKSATSQSDRHETLIGAAALTAQRLMFGAAVLLTIIFLSYFGSDMAQGGAFSSALNRAAMKTVGYLSRIIRGDLGLSSAGSVTMRSIPVVEIVPELLARSLGLLGASLFIATVIGIILGMAAAGRRNSGRSLLILMASIAGISVPSFFAAVILQRIIILWARNIGNPPVPVGGFGWDEHIILPALVLAARPIAQIARVTFISIGEVLEQDYIRTAHSKGLRPYRVMTRHVIRNAAIPILTTVGLSLRFSLSSLPVVEFFFGWPGLGYTLLKAISRQDDNLTIALLLCLGVVFILINLILEVSYRLIDPRLQKAQAQLTRRTSENPLETLKMIFLDFWEMLVYHPLLNLKNWFFKSAPKRRAALFAFSGASGMKRQVFESTATATASKTRKTADSIGRRNYRAERRRAWIRGTLGNLPLMIGAVLVLVLVVVVMFGPYISPHSPYTTHGLVFENGEFIKPPFAPDATYPLGTDVLGRDILTLILSGAQQTLILAMMVVAARMVLGFILGAIAGWLSGSWLDRLLLGATETIAAFPTLLLAMMLILALGIRSGMRPFVIALCFVGWGETMQFVRGEVMSIRPKLFIESAVAVGLRTPRIILSHVLPNLLASLISIAALEMGAVLMLLGELGFIGIFIGGGAFAELGWLAPPYHYSDVPEWGALLSNVRTYAQTYSWMAIYPSLAFFVAILGFNLFGEGIRRMVESVGLSITRLVNRYTVAAALLVIMGFTWAKGNTGVTAVYRQHAAIFDGDRAMAHVQALTAPEMEGCALGTAGLENAGDYIAQQFDDFGIQAAGEKFSYFQTRDRSYEILDSVPEFEIVDETPALAPSYGQDYAEYAGYYRDMGSITGRVRFLAMGELTRRTGWGFPFPALEKQDYANEVLLVLSDYDAYHLYNIPRGGILVVAENENDLVRRYTLSSRDRIFSIDGRKTGEDTPTLLISEEMANRLLEDTGHTVTDLRYKRDELVQDEIITLPTEKVVSFAVQGTVHDKSAVRHVLGHLPGRAGSIDGAPAANAAKLDNQLIVVMAQYDTPPPKPNGAPYPAANDNASAVAVMLETIRVMREMEYQPFRSFLFVAYSGEGLEGGLDMSHPDASEFLKAKYGFSSAYEIEAVVRLRGLGAGGGDDLVISASGSTRLADLFEEAARVMGVKTQRGGEMMDISIVFEDKDMQEGGQEAPNVGLRWEGWEATSRLPTDTLDTIAEDKLESSGRALTLALMILGRETEY